MQLADKYLGHARLLVQSQEPGDVYAAVGLLDGALKLHPNWEKALELKARCLLSLRRFREVASLLYEYIPSVKFFEESTPANSPVPEKVRLLTTGHGSDKGRRKSVFKFLSFSRIRRKLHAGFSKRTDREEWRYLVLGQACCHLGMLEDAMILLQSGKRAACAAFRRQCNCMDEDSYGNDYGMGPSELDLVAHLLGNIKFLLRRRAAALAAMEAGLYTESIRHFSKILDGRRGTPQGFIAECYMHRAVAHQAAGRIPDAIADCSRTLALDPVCVEALATRASLYEMVRCFYEAFQDLEQLKLLYEAILRHRKFPGSMWRLAQNADEVDVHANYQAVIHKLEEIRLRLERGYSIDYHRILGVPYNCSRGQVERAHLLICLKHRPDRAAHFVDRCEFVDDRDIEAVKEEARLAAIKLFCLIQRAHSGIIGLILDHEEALREKREAVGARDVKVTLRISSPEARQQLRADRPMDEHSESYLRPPLAFEYASPESQPVSTEVQVGSPSSVSKLSVSGSVAQTSPVVADLESSQDKSVVTGDALEEFAGPRQQSLEESVENNRSYQGYSAGLQVREGADVGTSELPFGLAELQVGRRGSNNWSSEQATGMCDPRAVGLVCVPTGAPLNVGPPSSVFSCLEDGVGQADTTAGAAGCRELSVVGVNLSGALSPNSWINASDNWRYQGYGTMSLQVT